MCVNGKVPEAPAARFGIQLSPQSNNVAGSIPESVYEAAGQCADSQFVIV